MTAVLEKPDAAPARDFAPEVECLSVWVEVGGGISIERNVIPATGSSIKEIVEAAKADDEFRNPLLASGMLTAQKDGRLIVLAFWSTDEAICWESGEVTGCTMHNDDGTTQDISV